MKILAISGSLRAASINSALLRAAARLAPAGLQVHVLLGVGELPLFNPDLEARMPPAVQALHAEVAAADALLIASPEYAHGVTGALKNLLDWLVSFEPFVGKPVAVFNASPRAQHADAALRETLRTMSAELVEAASISVPLLGAKMDEGDMVASPPVALAVSAALAALQQACQAPDMTLSAGGVPNAVWPIRTQERVMWTHQESIVINATPQRIWQLMSDVAGWPRWNAGVERIELFGPFAAGSTFSMQPPGSEPFTSTLLEVVANEAFTDETVIDGTRVVVDHRLEALPSGATRVAYSTQVDGPAAQEIGPMATADFGDVLGALKKLIEGSESR